MPLDGPQEDEAEERGEHPIRVPMPLTVGEFSALVDLAPSTIVRTLFKSGNLRADPRHVLTYEQLWLIAHEHDLRIEPAI